MQWNWQQPEWPHFTWDAKALAPLEERFLAASSKLLGAFQYLSQEEQQQLTIEWVSTEAVKTSAIEGRWVDRQNVQQSMRSAFGLETQQHNINLVDQGLTDLTLDLYQHFADPLSEEILLDWHTKLMKGWHTASSIGTYRTTVSANNQVIQALLDPRLQFRVPPPERVYTEMERFITWFNKRAMRLPASEESSTLLARAGMAHLYFESIHPFDIGNGRIGRALSEKILAHGLGRPTLILLSQQIEMTKRDYYEALARGSASMEITDWLLYFAETILEATQETQTWLTFLIAKMKLETRVSGQLNYRQQKVLRRLFEAGPNGFPQGLSAEQCGRITKKPASTITRDLQGLVQAGALIKRGRLRYTRYFLNLE